MNTEELVIGTEVSCTDGVCGDLRRVIVDPLARKLTHIVVETKHQPHEGRLVPIGMVAESDSKSCALTCSQAEFSKLENADETEFVAPTSGLLGYGPDQALAWPYYGLGMGSMYGVGLGGGGPVALGMGAGPHAITYDHVPLGEVEVARGDHVHAKDGAIGRVKGLAIDPGTHDVTHVLLAEGHLWGKKDIAIPIKAVTAVGREVQLSLTKDEVRDLPEVSLDAA